MSHVPSHEVFARDAALLQSAAGGPIDVGVILGSGLSDALAQLTTFTAIPYEKLGLPVAALAGHAGEALVGTIGGKRVVAFAGRVHMYQGFSAQDVTVNVTLSHLAGAKTMILTNAAGALNPAFKPGQLMLIEDHINLTGANPLVASGLENPFVDMGRCYSPRLRNIARGVPGGQALVEGVYLALMGPSYETAAEGRYLRGIGADAVGMSTVLETILARSNAMEVLGISLITNAVGAEETTHAEVTAVAKSAATRLAAIVAGVLEELPG